MIRLEEKIIIDSPIEEVFNFVANGENMALWNSAVFKIEKVSAGPLGMGTQFWMLRNLPSGRAENIFEVITYKPNTEFSIKTVSGPTPFVYHYHFTSIDSNTSLVLVAEIQLNGLGKIAKPLLAIGIRKGIRDNLNTLNKLMQKRATRPARSTS